MCHVTPAGLQVKDEDKIEVNCSVKFSGSIAPSIDCRWSAGSRWENVESSITNDTVAVELTLSVTPFVIGQTVQCETQFFFDNQSERSAGRPLYRHTWNSSVVHLVTGSRR